MKKTIHIVILVSILLALIILGLKFSSWSPRDVTPNPQDTQDTPENPAIIKSEGRTTMKIGDIAVFTDMTIEVLKVTEDSRCASDVQCVWAGQVKVEVNIKGSKGNIISNNFTEGSKISFEGYDITMERVEPYPISTRKIEINDYRFTFLIQKSKPVTADKCYVGGCSSEICSDRPDISSNCMYKEVFACYQGAICERQQNGQCGWTETPKLKACVASKL